MRALPVPALFRTLYGKLAAILFGLCLLLGILYTAWMIRTSQLYLQEVDQQLNVNLARHLAAERILMPDGRIDKDAAAETFRTLMVINRNIEIYLLDREGRIVAFSAAPGVVTRSHVQLKPIERLLAGEPLPIYGDDPRHDTRTKVFSATALRRLAGGQPVPSDDALHGYLYVILVGQDPLSALQLIGASRTLRTSAWGLGALILLTLVGALAIVRWLTRRLTLLAKDMEDFRASEFMHAPPIAAVAGRAPDEIDVLAIAFREMSQRIGDQIRRLQDVDRMRRDLVANVSHDLRTPVAAVHGYLETLLLKESALAPEERRRYLEVALRHSAGLNAMIEELFDLAKLDAREVNVKLEPFSLCELGQDVLQRFELLASRKGVDLEGVLSPTLPDVAADIRLIERVLVNLIENALRHTPTGGRVSLVCVADGPDVLVSVTDTGAGIPVAELLHIFERFYRPPTTTDLAHGAGLGLAIAKRILDLHGSTLSVVSEPSEGASFRFTLRAGT
ncbi:MAG TPA: HAMP domain-containing sensor histidine kinase [Vicinamibacterales bacterium]|nr:HAMP domain-containing sensor histidine kinase [Vicinamibacterales bacterium]